MGGINTTACRTMPFGRRGNNYTKATKETLYRLNEERFSWTFQKMLCMYAFPQCHNSVGLPLCYEDCMAVRHQFCFNDWAMIEDNKQRDIYIRSREHFTLPDCESLPKVVKGKVTCSHIHLTDVNEDLVTCKEKLKYLRVE